MRLALLGFLIGCGSTGPVAPPDGSVPGGPLQMNDVSLMFPLAGPPSSYLAASSSGSHGVLLPSEIYDSVGHLSGSTGNPAPGGTGEAKYDDLHVVAMRLDPCFATLAPDPHGTGCMNQLRLVFQQVTSVDGITTTFDSALHAFYQLERQDLVDLANAIASLRVENSSGERLGGLAPHPIMVSQGLDGTMARSVRALVLRYAGKENLTRVTTFSSSNADFTWTFAGFDLDSAGAKTPMLIASAPAGTTTQSFFRGFGSSIEGQFSPATIGPDDLTPLANAASAAQLSATARDAAWASLVRIDNPTRNSPNTIDCASCHLATPIARLVGPTLSLDEATSTGAFAADGVHVLASEMNPTFDATAGFNLHAFSYSATDPAINQRTVNETAAIVEYLSAP